VAGRDIPGFDKLPRNFISVVVEAFKLEAIAKGGRNIQAGVIGFLLVLQYKNRKPTEADFLLVGCWFEKLFFLCFFLTVMLTE